MSHAAYQKLSRIDIAVALDSTTSRFCVMYKELDAFANAAIGWDEKESIELDKVLLARNCSPDYHGVGEKLKSELSAFTADVVMSERSYLKETQTGSLDVRACLLAALSLWEMGELLYATMNQYPMVLRNMRSKNYKGIDVLDSMYHNFHKDTCVLVEERVRHLHFAVKAISMYAPAHASLHRSILSTLRLVAKLKPALIEFTQTHNQFVNASHPACVGAAAAYA